MQLILLSGGSGKRLWPLSNNARSKQFLPLLEKENGEMESMVQRVVRQAQEANLTNDITLAPHGRARVARAVHIQRVVKGLNLQRNARLCQAAGGNGQQEQDHHQPFRHECHEIAPPFPVQDRAGRLVLLRPCVTDSRCPSQRRQQRGDLDFTS